ncbi:MAG: octaprenyl diphosphate synthase [Betaproteobacteria bacterium]|nr:octaprenyl diphosphate synthase [Betaproteobacteria bacterium]
MQLTDIRSLIADEMISVDALIERRLSSDVPLVRRIAEHIIGGGGKRLRPALVILSAGCFGYRGTAHHELAAVIEFIHTATLLHDDIVDESDMRRGSQTANARFGNAPSVLVGDFLYSRAFQMMVSAGNLRVMSVLADATNTIAEGEVLQLINARNAAISEAEYLAVVRRKTAKLFEAAAQIGAIIAGADNEDERYLAQYGLHVGTAFQLIDDVLDYFGDSQETGKSLGDDLSEGKPTLPLIRVIQNGTLEQSTVVRNAILQGGRPQFDTVMQAIRATDALQYTRDKAQSEVSAACLSIERLNDSPYRDSLLELARFAVNRSH